MKRFLPILLVFIVLFLFSSCEKRVYVADPVSFYYPRTVYEYGVQDGVIAPEVRDGSGFADAKELLSLYLKGPESSDLASPFPSGTQLLGMELREELLVLTLTDEYGTLSGLRQSLADISLAKTAMELTGAATVEIHLETPSDSGGPFSSINEESILLLDESYITATQPQQ